jgi:hypothetical protein
LAATFRTNRVGSDFDVNACVSFNPSVIEKSLIDFLLLSLTPAKAKSLTFSSLNCNLCKFVSVWVILLIDEQAEMNNNAPKNISINKLTFFILTLPK